MKRHFHIKPVIFCLALIVVLSGFLPPLFTKAFALSIEEESKLGQKFVAQIRKYFELVEDEFANQFITNLGEYLIIPLKTKHFPFHFYIIKDNTLNAFAAPGGHIFIFSGLVEAMSSLDELAAVICHEIGHISARHLSQRMEQSKKISLATMAGILAGALIGGELSQALMAGSMAAGMQAQLHYSRNDERQADQLGFEYMEYSGFDPAGLIKTLQTLGKSNWLGTDKVPAYLLTHPTGPERMSNLDAMLSHFTPGPPKPEVLRLTSDFSLFKVILRAKCLDSEEAERLFLLDLENKPSSFLPHFGLGIVYKDRSEYELAIRHFRRALEAEPDSVPILRNLGETYQLAGQERAAISILEKALELDSQNSSLLYILALSYENLESYDRAIELLERLTYLKPVNSEVYYHLGFSYGRQNRLALAHYNFGVYFEKLGETQKAKFHFQKADSLSGSDPSIRKKIEDAAKGLL
jgi:predicted Zn-dependent protease